MPILHLAGKASTRRRPVNSALGVTQVPVVPTGHLRSYMRVELHERSSPETQDLRSPTEGDIEALGELMYRAYLGTIDYEDETLEQSVAEIRKTYQGDYGRFDPEHSSIAERNGLVVSATLITRWQDRPFVAFSMTDPRFARQGLARRRLRGVWVCFAKTANMN